MTKRILALARDRGSMQAIAPVIEALSKRTEMSVKTLATRDSAPVTQALVIPTTQIDDAAFAADGASCIQNLFDQHQPDLILMGFSPARGPAPETPEQYAILEARRRGVVSIAVQDYWGMYAERLSYDGRTLAAELVPDCLCVLDRRAYADLKNFGVKEHSLSITHNPWLDELAQQAEEPTPQSPPSSAIKILLASQPLASMQKVRSWSYNQYDIFTCLLGGVPLPSVASKTFTIQILPHPSENITDWNARLARLERKDVHVELCQERSIDLLRDADYFVTSHSTLAYEALYFGTPCISLRPTSENVMRLWIDDAGLSRMFHDSESLRQYLSQSNPHTERQRVLELKQKLSVEGLFFSDGNATQRVVTEVNRLIM